MLIDKKNSIIESQIIFIASILATKKFKKNKNPVFFILILCLNLDEIRYLNKE